MKRGPYKKASILQRLERRSHKAANGCWLWNGCALAFGYGQIGIAGHGRLVHRVAYEQLVGEIPHGMNVLHRCDNPRCWNPEHLFLGTHADNIADKVAKGRQRLVHNHPDVKLPEFLIPAAHALHDAGESWRGLARRFRVSHDLVRVRCLRS